MVYLGNAFSIDMLSSKRVLVYIQRISLGRVKYILKRGYTSLVKDEKICKVLSELLGMNVTVSDTRVKLKKGDKLVVVRFNKRVSDSVSIDDLDPRFAVIYIH